MAKYFEECGLIQSVSRCIKDAEGTIERIKEQFPRLPPEPQRDNIFYGKSQ